MRFSWGATLTDYEFMRFITSIFMLATAVTAVISAYFLGHWLVVRHEHHNWPILTFAALLGTSVVLGFIYSMLSRKYPLAIEAGGHDHGAHGSHTHTHADGTVHTHPHDPGHH